MGLVRRPGAEAGSMLRDVVSRPNSVKKTIWARGTQSPGRTDTAQLFTCHQRLYGFICLNLPRLTDRKPLVWTSICGDLSDQLLMESQSSYAARYAVGRCALSPQRVWLLASLR